MGPSALLERVLGRLPIGWLQLLHNKTRLLAAVAGVTFANVLVFMQLGFLGALIHSIALPYGQMNADLLISASDMNTLADGSPVPRQRMFEALGVADVAGATPLFYGKIEWKQPDGSVRTLDAFGVEPSAVTFDNADVTAHLRDLSVLGTALIDRRTRNVPREIFAEIDAGRPLRFETRGRTLDVTSTFSIGGGFTADGYLIMSDQTFLQLFPQRVSGAPNHILIKMKPGADRAALLEELRRILPSSDANVRSVAEAVRKDQAFQTTQRPVGLVFGFGIVIGIVVGIIIVYQVLATDVADHMKEYATFKAIGYRHRFFLGIIFEEAMILATLGFVPGILLSLGLYAMVASKTGLPLAMTPVRAIAVFAGTLVMCSISGIIATRRLARANPADLF
jgi:putative ABC transport system permease protein